MDLPPASPMSTNVNNPRATHVEEETVMSIGFLKARHTAIARYMLYAEFR